MIQPKERTIDEIITDIHWHHPSKSKAVTFLEYRLMIEGTHPKYPYVVFIIYAKQRKRLKVIER